MTRVLSLVLPAALFAAACGGPPQTECTTCNPTPHPDAGPVTPPADLLFLPLIQKHASNVMPSPKLVTITYPGDPLKADLDAFAQRLGQTSYWKAVTSEYGVGPSTAVASVVSGSPAPATLTDAQLQTLITSQVGTNWPSPSPNTIYLLYFPSTTTINGKGGFVSCQSYAGYHSFLTMGANQVAYAIIPRCQPDAQALDGVTVTASHEIAEAATDPFGAGYSGVDETHAAWDPLAAPGSEVGDMCEYLIDQNITPPDLGYAAQRQYSNAAAAAGHEACVPAPPDEKFAIAKVAFTDPINFDFGGSSGSTWGVHIPFGQTRTVDVVVAGDDPATLVTLSAKDLTRKNLLAFSFDRDIVHVGETVHLTITVTTTSVPSGNVLPFDTHAVVNGRIRYWFGFIAPTP